MTDVFPWKSAWTENWGAEGQAKASFVFTEFLMGREQGPGKSWIQGLKFFLWLLGSREDLENCPQRFLALSPTQVDR